MALRAFHPRQVMENPKSFRLEAAIAQWRAGVENSAAMRPADVDELEAHLRDGIRAQQARGAADEAAFTMAVQDLGCGPELSREFAKTNRKLIGMNRILWMLVGWTLGLWMTAPGEIFGALVKDDVGGSSNWPGWPALVYSVVSFSVEITAWIALGWYCSKHTDKFNKGLNHYRRFPWVASAGLILLNLAHRTWEWDLIVWLRNRAGLQAQTINAYDPWSFWNLAPHEAHGLFYLGTFSFLLWFYLRWARGERLRPFPVNPAELRPSANWPHQAGNEDRKVWLERALCMSGGIVFVNYILYPGYDWLMAIAIAFMPLGGVFLVLAMVVLQCAAFLGLGWMIWKHATQRASGVRRLEAAMLKRPAASAVCGLFIFAGAKAGFLVTGLVFNKFNSTIQPAGWDFSSCYNYGLTFWISVVPVILLLALAHFHTKNNSDAPFLIN